MLIRFEATLDELVEVYEHSFARSKLARNWRNRQVLLSGLLTAIVTVIPVFVFLLLIKVSLPLLIILGTIIATVAAFTTTHSYKDKMRQRIRALYEERYGKRETIPVEIEITPANISTKQLDTQIIREWSGVQEINQTPETIEFYFYDGSCIFVRNRAFSSEPEKEKFQESARHYLASSRNASNWLRDE